MISIAEYVLNGNVRDSNMILDLINSGINPREIEICA